MSSELQQVPGSQLVVENKQQHGERASEENGAWTWGESESRFSSGLFLLLWLARPICMWNGTRLSYSLSYYNTIDKTKFLCTTRRITCFILIVPTTWVLIPGGGLELGLIKLTAVAIVVPAKK